MIQRICPVSGSSNWISIFDSGTGRIITGDQRICDGNLEKVICPESGVVANKNRFSDVDLDILYGEEYELNVLGKEEHFFYTQNGPKARSEVFFDWIVPYFPENFKSLIEIGCGEGNLLARLAEKFPEKSLNGIDGSFKAVELAADKGLNVQRKLILSDEDLPQADVYLLVNVIEHVENLNLFINNLKQSLTEGGRIIFCLPVQDYGGYDIFFYEHVWHFTSIHFERVLSNNGLNLIYSDSNHPINHGIGLFVCEKSSVSSEYLSGYYSDTIQKNLEFWLANFSALNNLIKLKKFERIVLFGAGEVSTLFLAFSDLFKQNIIACIDDTKPEGMLKHGIPVFPSVWLESNRTDLLLLAVNKKYHPIIEEKLRHLNLNIHPIY